MKLTSLYTGVLTLFLVSTLHLSSAQTPLSEAQRQAEVPPAWPGCDPKLNDCTKSRMADFINANLQTPPEAKAQNAGGAVVMEFVIEKNGTIGEVRPMHDPGLGLGTEATRVINLMNAKKIKWIPAEDKGKKIAFRYITSISFNLNMPAKPDTITAEPKVDHASHVYDIVEVMPQFAGCELGKMDSIDCTFMKMISHIKTNLIYPEEALQYRIQGQVVAEFIIDSSGAVTQPVVLQSLGYGCDAEAIRILTSMPLWNPGRQDGQAVAVKMKVPIVFQLPKEKE